MKFQPTKYTKGDEVILRNIRNPIPMIIRQVEHNGFGKTLYKCSWQFMDGRIGNTIYKEEDLRIYK